MRGVGTACQGWESRRQTDRQAGPATQRAGSQPEGVAIYPTLVDMGQISAGHQQLTFLDLDLRLHDVNGVAGQNSQHDDFVAEALYGDHEGPLAGLRLET